MAGDDGRKHVGWCFTVNGIQDTNVVLPEWEDGDTNVECYVYQFERGSETGRLHIQGYIKWKHPVTFTKCKSTLPEGCHIEPARGTRQQNYAYCTKEECREPGTYPCVFGEFASEQGKRNDLLECTTKILGKRSVAEIALEHPNTYVKYHKGLEKLSAMVYSTPRDGDWSKWRLARWICGPTGVGKTQKVYQRHPGMVYAKDVTNKWWDGFDPLKHQVILIDDFPLVPKKEGIGFNDLLRICQPYPLSVEVKGGSVALGSQLIYITSNFSIGQVFGAEQNFEALERRIFQEFYRMPIKLEEGNEENIFDLTTLSSDEE